QGGASLQFSMLPMNLLGAGDSADYIISGQWGKKAFDEARIVAQVAGSGISIAGDSGDNAYSQVPVNLALNPKAKYVHFTSNETIGGVQWPVEPETGTVPLVADASSDILSRPIDMSRYGLIYAGAQKNLGP